MLVYTSVRDENVFEVAFTARGSQHFSYRASFVIGLAGGGYRKREALDKDINHVNK